MPLEKLMREAFRILLSIGTITAGVLPLFSPA